MSRKGDGELDAEEAFSGLDQKRKRELMARFDLWIDGGTHDNYFHGWPNDADYDQCYVFKWKEKNVCHRLYGFLCNPLPTTNAGFRLCVLISHAKKTQWNTDKNELKGANKYRTDANVKLAIKLAYPDVKGGNPKWLN